MRKFIVPFILILVLALASSAHAQSPVGFDTVDVSIWPEYDTPTVLVIYKLSLPETMPLPIDVTLKLPSGVGKVSALAVGEKAETVTDTGVDYRFSPGKDFSQVTVKATGRFLQVEYYDPGLVKNANQHSYHYEWPADYSVNSFRFEFRQPLQSTNLSIEPALTNTVVDSEGFSISEFKQFNIKEGQKVGFDIKYQRDTDAPSTSFLKVEPSTPIDQAAAGQSTLMALLPWGLGGLGVILLSMAGYFYWSSSKNNRITASSRKRHNGKSEGDEGSDSMEIYCSQCGKRAKSGDRFCRACGGRIRQTGE
ncbi:MAG: zinc ribbon domain-containing protein [Chloroflexota bacterium]